MRRVEWHLLTWPQAFVLVLGGVPVLVFLLGALGAFPAVMMPTYAVALGVYVWREQAVRRDRVRALALRADAQHAALRATEPDRFPTLPYGLRR